VLNSIAKIKTQDIGKGCDLIIILKELRSKYYTDSMKYKITHQTHYNYYENVNLAHNEAWLVPTSSMIQTCHKTHLHIEPRPSIYHEYTDFFGNTACHFSIQQPHDKMTVTATHLVEVHRNYHTQEPTPWEQVRDFLQESLTEEAIFASQFCLNTSFLTSLSEVKVYAQKSFRTNQPLLEASKHLMNRIFKDFKFVAGATTISTPLQQVFKQRKGVCQDFAHIGVACVRAMGLAARYVSGYIETIPAEGKEKLVGADASHAWFSVYHPTLGWVDFDPTNNQLANNQYITLAYGRDYADVPPLKGVIFSSGAHALKVSVDVLRV
jgi:transglutaminase-like putative cysteine protease